MAMRFETSTKFEAWKNFLLILAGVLVGALFQERLAIENGVKYFIDFNKVLSDRLKDFLIPEIISIFVILYFFRVVHGILVAIFDQQYVEGLGRSSSQTLLSVALLTFVIISTTFIPFFSTLIQDQKTVEGAALYLIGMIGTPFLVFLSFDLFHQPHDIRTTIMSGIQHLFDDDKEFSQVLGAWILQDALSIFAIGTGSVFFFLTNELDVKIIAVLVSLMAVSYTHLTLPTKRIV